MLRCSYLYKLKPHAFATFIWRNAAIWNRDIDKSIKDKDLELFASLNQTDLDIARTTTLRSYEGILYQRTVINGQNRFLNTTGVYHRKRKYYALMYCPSCLSQDKYFMKIWRLSVFTSCPYCEIDLNDRCYKCQSPIIPFRINISERLSERHKYHDLYMNFCWNCKTDLCLTQQTRSCQPIIQLTKEINDYLHLQGNTHESALSYFNRLNFFLRIIKNNKTLITFLTREKICMIANNSSLVKSKTFETLDLTERREVLKGYIYLQRDWPDNFKKYIKENDISYSDLISEKSHKKDVPAEVLRHIPKFH